MREKGVKEVIIAEVKFKPNVNRRPEGAECVSVDTGTLEFKGF